MLLPVTFLLLFSCFSTFSAQTVHRHRHSRSHPLEPEHDLDRLMNRLDNQASRSTPSPVLPDLPNSLWDDSQDTSTTAPLAKERWDKILKGADRMKQQEDLEDEEDDLDEPSEEEDGFDEQADSYRSWNSRSGESYTNWKMDNLGNRKSLDNLFQQHVYRSGQPKSDSAAAKEATAQMEVYKHNKLMARETLCQVPRPKVIRVSDIYPSSHKLYMPACTVLHQCGEDTGCCQGSGQRCGPKTTKRVELYFYTTYLEGTNVRLRTRSGMEKLPFYNHTECECIDKLEEVMPRDSQATDRSDRSSEPGCKCPSEYTVRRLANGSCSCDCFDKQRDCIKYKKGKEYFNHSDRLCIEMGTCILPSCDFGVYLRSSGRCPRKHEKFRTWSRFN